LDLAALKEENKFLPNLELEKKTFRLHLISQFFNGISAGIVLLQDIILKKSLGGSNMQVMALSTLVCTAFLVSIYGSELVNRSANRAKTIIRIGFAAKAFFIVLPLINSSIFYIVCISATAYLDSLLLSSWNIVLKHNYTEQNRSKLFSYATTLQIVMILAVSTVFGHFLDLDNDLYRLIFPFAGIFGMLTYYNLSKMISLSMDDYKGRNGIPKASFSFRLLKDILVIPLRTLLRIFQTDKQFLKFESYFFLYGIAFMVITPAVPFFLVDTLKLNYAPISIAKGLVFHSTLILFTPIMGRIHGSGNPAKFSGVVFIILTLFPLVLASAKIFSGMNTESEFVVYAAHFIFAIGISGINITWTLSSIYFAPPPQVANYQAAHITLTGIRGIFSPALGYLVMTLFGVEYVFYLSAFLFLLGGVLMLKQGRTISAAKVPI